MKHLILSKNLFMIMLLRTDTLEELSIAIDKPKTQNKKNFERDFRAHKNNYIKFFNVCKKEW